MRNKIGLLFVFMSFIHCSTAPKESVPIQAANPAIEKPREPSQAPLATELPDPATLSFDSFLERAGLKLYYANLHAHHFVSYKPTRGNPADMHHRPGPCDPFTVFPEDDGRPCRAKTQDQPEIVLPPSLSNGALDPLDYIRMSCEHARNEGGLDILMVTPHTKNNGLSRPQVADTKLETIQARHKALSDLNKTYNGSFYCGLGQEASSISKGNHVNIFGHMKYSNPEVKPYFFPEGLFDVFYREVGRRLQAAEPLVLQLNHPDIHGDDHQRRFPDLTGDLFWGPLRLIGDRTVEPRLRDQLKEALNDYGIDDFPPLVCALTKGTERRECAGQTPDPEARLSNKMLRETFDSIRKVIGDAYRLIEVVETGGATSDINSGSMYRRTQERATFPEQLGRLDGHIKDWIFYLKMGFKVAPTANQDNHFINPGSAIANRTGVLAKSLAEDDVFEALHRRLTFATEDRNAELVFGARVDNRDALMGEEITTSQNSLLLEIGYNDPDEEDASADLRIYYYHDDDELDFTKNAGPWALARTVVFTDQRPLLPEGPAQPIDQIGWLTSGKIHTLNLPLKPGDQIIFVEYTQVDKDKVWSAPLFVHVKPN